MPTYLPISGARSSLHSMGSGTRSTVKYPHWTQWQSNEAMIVPYGAGSTDRKTPRINPHLDERERLDGSGLKKLFIESHAIEPLIRMTPPLRGWHPPILLSRLFRPLSGTPALFRGMMCGRG